jgi:hydrogenase nickel incorporation protein HypA/HybF
MHEMSIAQSIVDIVKEEMARHGLERVHAINLVVGKLAAVVPEQLNMCFGMLTDKSELAGTLLTIRELPIGYRCTVCSNWFTSEVMTFECPNCSAENPMMVTGRELTVENIEVAD